MGTALCQKRCTNATPLNRSRRGDQQAFEALVQRYEKYVLSVARQIVRNDADAWDVSQAVWLQVFHHIESFEGRSAFTTWLYRVTTNAALMHLRRRTRRAKLAIPSMEQLGYSPSNETSADAPDSDITARQTSRMLRRVLASLPDTHREVLQLRVIEDLSNSTTAERLGVSPGAAKVRLHRAKAALANCATAWSDDLR